jgi:hypothetical protein
MRGSWAKVSFMTAGVPPSDRDSERHLRSYLERFRAGVGLHLESTNGGDWLVEGIARAFPVPPVSMGGPLRRGVIPPA